MSQRRHWVVLALTELCVSDTIGKLVKEKTLTEPGNVEVRAVKYNRAV